MSDLVPINNSSRCLDRIYIENPKIKGLLFAVSLILGGVALATAGLGLANFGAAHQWWVISSYAQIPTVYTIPFMAVGGTLGIALITLGILNLKAQHHKPARPIAASDQLPPPPVEPESAPAQPPAPAHSPSSPLLSALPPPEITPAPGTIFPLHLNPVPPSPSYTINLVMTEPLPSPAVTH